MPFSLTMLKMIGSLKLASPAAWIQYVKFIDGNKTPNTIPKTTNISHQQVRLEYGSNYLCQKSEHSAFKEITKVA